jgi:hypothetical protein
MKLSIPLAVLVAMLPLGLSATPASAAPTPSATLSCGSTSYEVTGFGRGEVLHLVGTNTDFVVTYARLEPSGQVVIDIAGQRTRPDLLTCTTVSPLSGTVYTFKGFLTPRD